MSSSFESSSSSSSSSSSMTYDDVMNFSLNDACWIFRRFDLSFTWSSKRSNNLRFLFSEKTIFFFVSSDLRFSEFSEFAEFARFVEFSASRFSFVFQFSFVSRFSWLRFFDFFCFHESSSQIDLTRWKDWRATFWSAKKTNE